MSNDYYEAPTAKTPLTTIRSTVRNDDAAAVEAGFEKLPSELDIKRSQYGDDVSTSAALYEITVNDLDVAYYEGLEITFQALFENTGPANISVNGGTNVKIVDTGGNDIIAGSIKEFQGVTVLYVLEPTPNFQLISTAATAQDVQDAKDAADRAEQSADRAEASASFSLWNPDDTFDIPAIVIGSDDNYYENAVDGNKGNDPTSTTGFWDRIDFVRDGITSTAIQHFYRNR